MPRNLPPTPRAEKLLAGIKALLAKSEQSRHFGPAACRKTCLELIEEVLERSSSGVIPPVVPAKAWCETCRDSHAPSEPHAGEVAAPAVPVGACISCGEANDGGYCVDDGPGPFCSQCWEMLETCFKPVAPVGASQVERDLLCRADSYLSLLWYRHTPAEIKADIELRIAVERTIGELRAAYRAISCAQEPTP